MTVVLAAELAHSVRGEQDDAIVLVDRDRPRIAVNRSGRCVHDPVDLAGSRREQNIQSAADIGGEVIAGIGGRGDDISGGHVKDKAVRRDQLIDERRIRNRSLNEFCSRWDRFGQAREEVVEDGHASSGVDELLGEGAAHKSGPTRHQDPPAAERPLRCRHHRLTPVLSKSAGRNRRHQSRRPRMWV